ncbi:biotin/lipoyl-containing protein, partial [Pseudonocardia pini]|uniref:biotin/lipoyl-containing protein n=1 Tax=Pseudonocardia pini TaxID=2758030 RepID=UPI0028B01E6D
MLAKVIVRGDAASLAPRAVRALAEFDLAGVPTNRGMLQALLAEPGLVTGGIDTAWVDAHTAELVAAAPQTLLPEETPEVEAPTVEEVPDAVVAARPGVVVQVVVSPGDEVAVGAELVVLEAMKMEH